MASADWSFSPQWAEFNERKVAKTWSWTLSDRTAMFLREVDLTPEELSSMRVLDAGCGNGQLTNQIARWAKEVVGLDRSSSVDAAEANKTFSNVRYVQGDLNDPPLDPGSFDLVYSSGVVHHNRSTEESFKAGARMVKPGGRYYCLVYRPATEFIPWLTLAVNEPMRWVVCRFPLWARKLFVGFHAAVYHAILSVIRPGKYTYDEHVIAAFDATTPRYANRHWPHEMARWFHEAGFDSPKLTHWDNGGGFGMVAERLDRPPACPAGPAFKA